MPIDHDAFLATTDLGRRFSWDDGDTMLYALAAGMGRDAVDPRELPFVFEGAGLRAIPTQAVVIARSPLARSLPLDRTRILHGEQWLTLHQPLPPQGTVLADSRVTQVLDKGADKGAVVYHETVARLEGEDDPLFTLRQSIFARGDGGFGGPPGPAPVLHPLPDRDPDIVQVTETRADQALLYRLTGDRNPLHADPALAQRVGFPRPILHGLCTYAIACRAVLATVCDCDPARIARFDVRFTAPVLPGDRIETDIWMDGPTVSFRCRVPDRGVIAINNGLCALG